MHWLSTLTLLAASVTASPLLALRATSAGCGKARTPGYSNAITIQSGGRARTFKVQVPPNYNRNAAYSLIHGKGGTSDSQRANSMYSSYAASSNYVIVYPQGLDGGSGSAWQGPTYASPGVDDVQFVADLLTYLKNNYCINTDRIYASGKSNGGGFVDTLACSDTGDQFAAFAMAAAALYTDNTKESCTKKRAILESHGDDDNTIPYLGGQGSGGPIPNVGKWVRFWGERNCGTGAPSSRNQQTGYHIQTFSCNGYTNVVSHYHLYSPHGHCWPQDKGTNSDAKNIPNGCGDSKVLDYTPVVLDWFGKWNLQNAPKQTY